tara:strand:+ start:87 stop:353 length:267 start_codon:yes stop_codon:yes gene_type:complete
MTTQDRYSIVQFYKTSPPIVLASDLTLEEALEQQCERSDTHTDGWFAGGKNYGEEPLTAVVLNSNRGTPYRYQLAAIAKANGYLETRS